MFDVWCFLCRVHYKSDYLWEMREQQTEIDLKVFLLTLIWSTGTIECQLLKGLYFQDGRSEQAQYNHDDFPHFDLPDIKVPSKLSFCLRYYFEWATENHAFHKNSFLQVWTHNRPVSGYMSSIEARFFLLKTPSFESWTPDTLSTSEQQTILSERTLWENGTQCVTPWTSQKRNTLARWPGMED